MHASLFEIAAQVNGVIVGSHDHIMITSLAPIDCIVNQSLVFVESDDYLKIANNSTASAILAGKNVCSTDKPVIQVENPFQAFMTLVAHFYPQHPLTVGVHPTASVDPDAQIGQNVSIGAYTVIEKGCRIGDNCVIKSHVSLGYGVTLGSDSTLHPHVVVYDGMHIGSRVVIHASSVIGSDGFGYRFEHGQHNKVQHVGTVKIEDDVEIGANTCIDRATLGETVIGKGTKIDNFVQIAHNVKLGQHNILCAFTGIAGSTTSGNHVVFAANVGVSDHVKIDDGVILGARAGVPPKKHLKHGNIYLGSPARPKDKALEQELSATRIPFISKNLRLLSKKMDILEQKITEIEETS